MTPQQRLRNMFVTDGIKLLGGAHDALSGKLVEETEFEGVWASGFGISLAQYCMPDADLMTMTETLSTVRNIVRATSIPVVADCDAGYGNAINVMRVVREYENAGVAGICIEDNPFPKRCSLWEGWARELLHPEEMAGKIRAALSARQNPDFVLIARVEALIAGHDVDAALHRAETYAAAGADAILIHAKAWAPLREFCERWTGTLPLVAVPTLFNEVTLKDLESYGFKIAIFANQAVRAAIQAMRSTLQTIRQTGVGKSVDDQIVPLSDVYKLVDLEGLKEKERLFLPQQPAHKP